MNVLERLHKTSIRATDIASQYWCELKMELGYTKGEKVTAEMRKGRSMHEELEEQVNEPIPLEPKNYADYLYKMMYTNYVALGALAKNGRTREVQVYGSINGYRLVGKIDELTVHEDGIVVVEDKTKDEKSPFSEPKLRPHRVQVMLYRKMLEDLRSGAYTSANFCRSYGVDRLAMTPEFTRQLDAAGIDRDMRSIKAVSDAFFARGVRMEKLSDSVMLRYLDRFTGKLLKTYKLAYSEGEVGEIIKFSMKYWNGEREALPVPSEEKWKCQWCVFFGKECKVWWPQKGLQG